MSDGFLEGYEYGVKTISGEVANRVNDAKATTYLGSIDTASKDRAARSNHHAGNKSDKLQGFVLEDAHVGWFNIDAASKRTGDYAYIPPPKDYASVDIRVVGGADYQLKNYDTAKKSAFSQAISYKQEYRKELSKLRKKGLPEITPEEFLAKKGLDPCTDMTLPKYEAQARLIPVDQIEDAVRELRYKIAHLRATGRLEEIPRYQDTLDKLVTHITGPNGAQSKPLTREESMVLTSLARRGAFDPARFDLTVAKKADYLFLCQNILYSGLSAATVSAVLKAAPDIADLLWTLVRDGVVDLDDLENIGRKGAQGAKDGFIRGVLLASVKDACSLGYFGEKLQEMALDITNPAFNNVLVVLVTVILDTIPDSIKLSKGEMSFQEFSYRMDKRVFISGCSVAVGLWTQAALPIAPILGYALGSFVGSILGGVVFTAKERFMMSTLCLDYGFTFFGLIEEDYSLPDDVLRKLGYETFKTDSFDVEPFDNESFQMEELSLEPFATESFGVLTIYKGIIGVRKVGYKVS